MVTMWVGLNGKEECTEAVMSVADTLGPVELLTGLLWAKGLSASAISKLTRQNVYHLTASVALISANGVRMGELIQWLNAEKAERRI